LQVLASGKAPAPGWLPVQLTRLAETAQPHAAVELPVIASLKLLVAAAAEQGKHASLSDEAWRQLLKTAIAPPPKPAAAQ
jgi:hexosaminidase